MNTDLSINQLLGRIAYFHALFVEPTGIKPQIQPHTCCRHRHPATSEGSWSVLREIAESLGAAGCRCCPACTVRLHAEVIARCWIDAELAAYGRTAVPVDLRRQWAAAAGNRLSQAAAGSGHADDDVPPCDLPLTGELLALWADPHQDAPVASWLNHCNALEDIARVLTGRKDTMAPIHFTETLTIGSVEGFLTPDEIAGTVKIMDECLAEAGLSRFDGDRRASIHEIPGHTAQHAMLVYEPSGRVEIANIPAEAESILQHAFDRVQAAVCRSLPSVSLCRPWTYVEYGPGQHITTHLDGIAPDPLAWPRQIAGISVVISEADQGGGFYVETTSDDRLWERRHTGDGYAPGTHLAWDGADQSADWFRAMPTTRWTVSAPPGTALLYGSQLAHGTEPVVGGRCRKFISWLIAEGS